jgi:hypothetical protein
VVKSGIGESLIVEALNRIWKDTYSRVVIEVSEVSVLIEKSNECILVDALSGHSTACDSFVSGGFVCGIFSSFENFGKAFCFWKVPLFCSWKL